MAVILRSSNVKTVTSNDLLGTPLGRCLVPNKNGFQLLRWPGADDADPTNLIGDGEIFRLSTRGMVMVGAHGTIVSATPQACKKECPTLVSLQTNGDGYHVISNHYGCETHRVARLVASVWVPGRNPAAGVDEVDHLDGNRTNDVAANLEWTSHGENIHRSYLRPGRRPRREWTADDVVLLVPRRAGGPEVNYGQPLLVYAAAVAAITKSSNVSHCLTYQDRLGCGQYWVYLIPYTWVHPDDLPATEYNRVKAHLWAMLDRMEARNGIRYTYIMAMGLLEKCYPLNLSDMHTAAGYYYYAHYIIGGGSC